MNNQIELIIKKLKNNKTKSIGEIIDKYIKEDKMLLLNEVIKELSKQGYEIISTDPFKIKKN